MNSVATSDTTRVLLTNSDAPLSCVIRVKEAIQLVEMYNSHHQCSQMKGMEALKVVTKNIVLADIVSHLPGCSPL